VEVVVLALVLVTLVAGLEEGEVEVGDELPELFA